MNQSKSDCRMNAIEDRTDNQHLIASSCGCQISWKLSNQVEAFKGV